MVKSHVMTHAGEKVSRGQGVRPLTGGKKWILGLRDENQENRALLVLKFF